MSLLTLCRIGSSIGVVDFAISNSHGVLVWFRKHPPVFVTPIGPHFEVDVIQMAWESQESSRFGIFKWIRILDLPATMTHLSSAAQRWCLCRRFCGSSPPGVFFGFVNWNLHLSATKVKLEVLSRYPPCMAKKPSITAPREEVRIVHGMSRVFSHDMHRIHVLCILTIGCVRKPNTGAAGTITDMLRMTVKEFPNL